MEVTTTAPPLLTQDMSIKQKYKFSLKPFYFSALWRRGAICAVTDVTTDYPETTVPNYLAIQASQTRMYQYAVWICHVCMSQSTRHYLWYENISVHSSSLEGNHSKVALLRSKWHKTILTDLHHKKWTSCNPIICRALWSGETTRQGTQSFLVLSQHLTLVKMFSIGAFAWVVILC